MFDLWYNMARKRTVKKSGRPPLVTKAGVKHGARYGCGGKKK